MGQTYHHLSSGSPFRDQIKNTMDKEEKKTSLQKMIREQRREREKRIQALFSEHGLETKAEKIEFLRKLTRLRDKAGSGEGGDSDSDEAFEDELSENEDTLDQQIEQAIRNQKSNSDE